MLNFKKLPGLGGDETESLESVSDRKLLSAKQRFRSLYNNIEIC